MSDISQGNFAKIILKPGDSVRVTTGGVASVESRYGAPAGTTTVTANSATFGPYNVEASLKVTATSGTVSVVQIGAESAASASAVVGARTRSGKSAFQVRTSSNSRLAANSTIAMAIGQAGGFRAFRLIVRNASTAVTLNVTAKAAVSATATPTGSGLTPVNVTWGRDAAGALLTTKAVPVGSSANMIGGQATWGVAVSDWIGLESIPRTDVVGADPVLYLRIASPDGLYYDPIDWTSAFPAGTGRALRTAFANGTDNVATWANNMTLQSANANVLPDVSVEFLTGGKLASVVVFADSLAAGNADPAVNYVLAAQQQLNTAGLKFGIANMSIGGERRQTTSGKLQSTVPLYKPDFVVLHDYSVNSNSAPAITVDEQWTYLCNDIATVVANGATPIIVTMHTKDTYAARTRAAFTGVYPICDMSALLSNGAGGIQDQYCANSVSDRTHLSAAGALVVGSALANLISTLVL
jgi:hypothetical protein